MRLATLTLIVPLALSSLASGGAAAPTPASRTAAAGLVLNEFMAGPARDWDGSGAFSSRDDEWVEVRNAGAGALDLSGYLITDGDSIPRYALSGTLAAGERLVVFGKQSFDWEHATGYPAFGFSLGNSGDAVILWQVVAGDTLVVDAYTYRSHEAAADRAVGRLMDTGDWALFDGLDPYTGSTSPIGTGCNPTPAATNACGITPTRPVSWGRLKTIYR